MPVRLFVKLMPGGGEEETARALRELRRLLRRHRDRIVAVAVVMVVDSPHQAAALAGRYNLRPAPIPAAALLPERQETRERG